MTIEQRERTKLPPAEYDEMVVGDEFGPVDLVVNDAMIRSFAYAVDDFRPWYLQDSPFGGRVAPASMLATDMLGLWTLKYDAATDRGLHAKQELLFHEPIRVGQRVRLSARFTDKYIKRDKPYVATEGEVQADDGRRLMTFRCSEMVGMKPGLEVGAHTAAPAPVNERVTPRQTMDLPVVERARADLPIGSPLPSLRKRVTLKQMIVFSMSERSAENMHTDTQAARAIGLTNPIAQGLMSTGYLADLCTNFFEETWFTSGWTSMAFLRPIYANDTLVVRGVVSGRQEEAAGTRIELEVWCEDEEGRLVTAGRASALAS